MKSDLLSNDSQPNIILSISLIGLIFTTVSTTTHAGVEEGYNWLKNLSDDLSSDVANSLQTKQEVTNTLSLYSTDATELYLSEVELIDYLEKESSSEGLVRLLLLANSQNDTIHAGWEKLINNQNLDGGFGHVEGWQSNPLDTSFVLIALSKTNYLSTLDNNSRKEWLNRLDKALGYLATQQYDDGAYRISHLDDLYTSSYVLTALTPYLKNQGQYIPIARKLVDYLESKQTAPATWSDQTNNKGLFLDALVAESLYPYQDTNDIDIFRSSFNDRVLSIQNSDGSWQDDAYLTALVLNSVNKLSETVTNPITSAINLSIIDTETNLPISGVVLTANTISSPQRINALSTADGSIVLNDLEPGNYEFKLRKEGYASVQFSLRLQKGEQLNLSQIKLSRAAEISNGQIQGVVTSKVLGSPIPNATVAVVLVDSDGEKLDGFAPIITTTNNDGAYQIVLTKEQQEASQGRFGIDVRTSGYVPVQGSGTATAGGVTLFSPQLIDKTQSQAILRAKVVDNTGQPLSDVLFTNKSNNESYFSDASGSIAVNSLDSGSQVWTLTKEGYQGVSFSFVVEGANTYDVGVITLNTVQLTDPNDPNSEPVTASTGTFVITPTDAVSKQKLQGFKVSAEKINESTGKVIQTQSFVPDQEQSLASELSIELQTGRWRITVSHPAYKSSAQTLSLNTDEQITVDPALVLNPYALSGSIVDSQTNEPIANAPVAVFDNDTERNLYTGKSDSSGNFTIPSNLSASNVRIEIDPALYLSTTRYVSRQAEIKTNVNLGEIRLRPKSAEVVLPDLTITSLDSSNLTTDQQLLTTTGMLKATVENKGNVDLLSTEVGLTAFIDENKNLELDENELILGRLTETLGLEQGATTNISLTIKGKVDFRDAPIAVMIDSEQQVAERDEDNNVRLTSDGIEIKPPQGTLEAEEVWMYGYKASDSKKPSNWSSFGSSASPVAAPLEDTNNDGIIGQGDISSIIYNNYFNQLVVLDGQTGKKKWSDSVVSQYTSPAIADLDNDGIPEIVVNNSNEMRVYSNAGSLKKTWNVGVSSDFYLNDILIADLNADGSPEIIVGNSISNYSTGLITRGKSTVLAIADLDDDGIPELITNRGSEKVQIDADGTITSTVSYFSYNNSKAFGSVADITGDGKLNIVTTGDSYITILDSTGKQVNRFNIPTGGRGGVPTLADFDGNGIADIGVAGAAAYTVMRSDGSIIWSSPTQDRSSNVTGSSIFDFNNDGNSEVVYADEDYFRIYDAQTGSVIYQTPNSSHTAHEAPIVVDANADGHADVLFISNNNTGRAGRTAGIRMISSKNKDWANTRNIWNQYSYHITNINDDLSIPKKEPNSWEVHNTYRANLIPGINVTAASDLTASYIQIDDKGASTPSRFTARIGNAGGKSVAKGTPVSFYRLPKNTDDTQAVLIGKVTLTDNLAGGDYTDLSIDYAPANGSLADFGELIVIANDAGAGVGSATGIPNPNDPTDPMSRNGVVQEYTRSNNIARIAVTGDYAAFSLVGSVDKTYYTANDTVTITALPTNLGSFPTSPTVRVSIIDSVGNVVQQFTDSIVDLSVALTDIGNPPVNSATVLNTWQTGQTPTGNYSAHIELIYQDTVVAELDRNFAIVTDGELSAQTNSQLYVDKTQYLSTDLVQIHSRIINTASNAMSGQRDVTLTVTDPSGNTIWTQPYSYNELAPNAVRDQYFSVKLDEAMVGDYLVTSSTIAADGSQAKQVLTQSFKVLSVAQSGLGVSGTLTTEPNINVGETVDLQWTVNNLNSEQIEGLPLSIALFKGNSSAPFKTIPLSSVNINADGSISGFAPWNSSGSNEDVITAVLVAEFAQGQKGLAQSQIILFEPPVEVKINDDESLDDTLLVYYSCAPGWHTAVHNFSLGFFQHECFDQRASTLERYLERIKIPYKLVKHPAKFADEMQSGKYAQYWLLGAIEQLRPHARKELVELTYSGDNLLIDSGMNSWLNQNLYPLAGVKHKGRLLLNNDNLTLINNFILPPLDTEIANTSLSITNRSDPGNPFFSSWAQWLEPINLDKTEVWAQVTGQPKRASQWAQRWEHDKDYPSIVSQHYGNGKPVATNFDVISSLDLATSAQLPPYSNNSNQANVKELHWDNVLTQLLSPRRQNVKSDYVPNEVVRIPIELSNSGRMTRAILVEVDLPLGSQWLGYKGGMDNVIKNSDTVSYQIMLNPEQSINDILTIRLPKTTGAHAVRLSISDVTDGSSQSSLLKQSENRYLVRDIDSRIRLLNDTIQHWSFWSKNGHLKLNAKTQISLIKTHRKTGARQLAVYEAARLGDTLSLLQRNDNSVELEQLRYELDELLRALQIDWYIARDGYIPPA